MNNAIPLREAAVVLLAGHGHLFVLLAGAVVFTVRFRLELHQRPQ